MSHDIEVRENGKASFVGARESAWHRLGTVFEDRDGLTVAEVCKELEVGQVIGTEYVEAPALVEVDGMPSTILVKDHTKKMTVRVRPNGEIVPLGIVAQKYRIIQETEAFGFIDAVVDAGEGIVSAAGLLDGGKRAFCCLKLPQNILIGGVDAVDLYLFIVTSHDGTLATTAAATPIRVVCQNTVTMGLRAAVKTWKVRHTSNAMLKIEEARRALELTFAYEEAWKVEAEQLIATKVAKRQYEAMAKVLFPAPKTDSKASKTAHEKVWEQVMGLWGSDTQDDIKGTAWGAYNAFVEHADWFRGTRGADDPTAQQFYTSLTSGHGTVRTIADFKDRALEVVKAKSGLLVASK